MSPQLRIDEAIEIVTIAYEASRRSERAQTDGFQ